MSTGRTTSIVRRWCRLLLYNNNNTTVRIHNQHNHGYSGCRLLSSSSSLSSFFQSKSKILLTKVRHWMEHHPVYSNSLLCAVLWIVGDISAQLSEHATTTTKQENELYHPQQQQQRADQKQQKEESLDGDTTTTASINWIRTLQCTSFGAVVTGPILALWYPFLDTLCHRNNITARFGVWGAPVAKVLADEFIMDPPFLCLFYGYMTFCETVIVVLVVPPNERDSEQEEEKNGSRHGDTRTTTTTREFLPAFQQKLQSEWLRSWFTSLAVWPWVLLGTFRYLPVFAQAPVINACNIVWDAYLSHRNAVAAKHNNNGCAKHSQQIAATEAAVPAEAIDTGEN